MIIADLTFERFIFRVHAPNRPCQRSFAATDRLLRVRAFRLDDVSKDIQIFQIRVLFLRRRCFRLLCRARGSSFAVRGASFLRRSLRVRTFVPARTRQSKVKVKVTSPRASSHESRENSSFARASTGSLHRSAARNTSTHVLSRAALSERSEVATAPRRPTCTPSSGGWIRSSPSPIAHRASRIASCGAVTYWLSRRWHRVLVV